MASPADNPLKRLIREIHRRSLWQVLGIYLVGGWFAYEIVRSLTEGLSLPEWFPAFAVVLLVIGLPIVLATAFVQEGKAGSEFDQAERAGDGVTAQPQPETAGAWGLFTWRNAILGGVGAFALWGILAALALATDLWPSGEDAEAAANSDTPFVASVAVLPFDNIGGQQDVAHLSEGFTEEITAQLARVPDLHVISRTSAEAVSGFNLTTPQIADTLGVEHVLEGSVQLFVDQIRVTAQLIHAETDNHLWADSYNGPLADLFSLQEDIAIKVTAALMGVNINAIHMATFALGSGLAAAAGALLGPVCVLAPTMGDMVALKAFAIVILGGLGNFMGAALGGLILALVEEMGAGYISSGYRDAIGFLIIIAVLIYKPTGLFARAERIG